MTSNKHILLVKNLVVDFPNMPTGSSVLRGVSLSLKQGEILGIVGESGCGKSVLARSLVRLESPARIISGSILLDGQELIIKSQRELRRLRGRKISLALQDPRSAMDPVFMMGNQLKEVVSISHTGKRAKKQCNADILRKIHTLLKGVGIASPKERCRQYPHEWSRGMLQRAQLVMVSSASPEVLILDEITSALDPTISLQILDLIIRLKTEQNTGIILITHDLSIALEICDRVAVMQKGRIVEMGKVRKIFEQPVHPYTKLVVSCQGADGRIRG